MTFLKSSFSTHRWSGSVWGTSIGVMMILSLLNSSMALPQPVIEEAPKTGPEQLILKVKENAFAGISPSVSHEEVIGLLVGKYAKVKKAKKHFINANKGLSQNNNTNAQNLNNIFSLEIDSEESLTEVIEQLRQDPLVEYVQWNYLYEPDTVPNDPMYNQQWSHPITQAPEAWDLTIGDSNVVIAVIGTGVKWDHEDLDANIWNNSDEVNGNSFDDDGNGYIDDIRGWNFELDNNDPTDRSTHETAVAGVAAAETDNGVGVAGVCWQCKIMPLRVSYTSIQVTDALYYAINNGAKIVNMSFGNYDPGKYGPDTIVETAINFGTSNDILMVATAGNDSINTMRFPGALDSVIGVASTDATDTRSSFSNWGEWVDIAAPGSSVPSTIPGGYANVSGTSFSAPYVSGVAGLLFSRFPSLSLSDARLIIEYTADRITPDRPIGAGRINAYQAILSSSPPAPVAAIKNIWNGYLMPESGLQEIHGTALGDSYVLDYKAVGESDWIPFGTGAESVDSVLGQLDVTSLTQATQYDIRLTATQSVFTDTHIITVISGGGYQSGWPTPLGEGAILSPPNVADVDGDGEPEIVVGTSTGAVFVLESDGSTAAGWPQFDPNANLIGKVAVGDIDGDGDLEIIATTYGSLSAGASISAWHHNGVSVSGWPKTLGRMRGGAALVNLDSDPALEIVAGKAGNASLSQGAQIYVWNGDGSLLPGWPYTDTDYNLQTTPAIGDVDGDGQMEIVIAPWTGVVILRADGSVMNSWAKSSSHMHPILTDIDSDGDVEIGMSESSVFVMRDENGTVLWQKSLIGSSYSQGSSGDIVGDPTPEVFFAGSSVTLGTSEVYAWNSQGVDLPGWPRPVSGTITAEPTLGDLDGDGFPEIIVATEQGMVYAWDSSGALMPTFPKTAGSGIYGGVAITDLDLDGDTELVAGSVDGTIHVWDLSGSYNLNAQPWPEARHDDQNTGSASAPALPVTYTLQIAKTGSGTGVVTSVPAGIICGIDCIQAYGEGTVVTLTATPDAGSVFTGWSGDLDCAEGSVTMLGNRTCIAQFDASNNPPILSLLQQREFGGICNGLEPIVPIGTVISGQDICLEGSVADSDADNIRLEVEVRPFGTSFTGIPNFCSPADCASFSAQGIQIATVTGLTQDLGYSWKARAVDDVGNTTAWIDFGSGNPGADFVTADFSLLPLATTGSATKIKPSQATLNGTANPQGLTGTTWFEYGLDTSYGNSSSIENVTGSTDIDISIIISGLSGGTTYHYRLVVQTAAGISYGSDATFKTKGGGGGGGNKPPTADAGNDQTVTDTDDNGSEVVTLDGSASSDSDGSIVSYLWEEGTTTLGTTAIITPTLLVGTHNITLTVTDDLGAQGSDTVVITVSAVGGEEPDAPTGLTSSVIKRGKKYKVELSWNANTPQPASYRVYRSTTSGSGYTQVGSDIAGDTTDYRDNNVPTGTTHYYVVRAVGGTGTESSDSNETTAVIP